MLQKHHVITYGWLDISFENVIATTQSTGQNCDVFSQCDTYIKCFVDGAEDFETETILDTKNPNFSRKYRSSRIRKDSRLSFEMWDFDAGSSHDLLLSRDTNVDELLSYGNGLFTISGHTTSNQIGMRVSWTEEPVNLD